MENDDIKNYDGKQVILTVLDIPRKKRDISLLENDSFVIPSDRAERRRKFFQSKKSVIPSGRTAEEIAQELKELRNDRF